jgi:hypothetical protein
MNEETAIVALVLLAAAVVAGLIRLWRKPAGSLEELDQADHGLLPGDGQWAECPRATLDHIFGSHDLGFVRAKGSDQLCRAFERDRRQIALNWVWSAFDETHRIMARHFRAVRSSPDLSISLEAKLVAEVLLHQILCLMLVAAMRLAGPEGLARLAGAIGNLRHQVGVVTEGFPDSARGDFSKDSGLHIHS